MAVVGPAVRPLSEFLSWDEADQDAALAWKNHEAQRCPGCGRHPDDPPQHWHMDLCRSCEDLEEARERAAGMRGMHIKAVAGRREDCPRCTPKPKRGR